jgi:hypothetical protein
MAFAATMFAAAELYPGGSWTDPDAQGFSWLRNFWCDLLRSRAINGADNGVGKQLASVGFAALGAALWPYWWVAASLLAGQRKRWVAVLGMISAASLGAMAFLPSDQYPILHGAVALGGGLLGIGCAWVCVATRLGEEARASVRRVSGMVALVLAVLNATLYVYVAYGGGDETAAQPLVQKLATAALLVWMLTSVREAQRRSVG